MARPITLFTGQWADLPFDEVCRLASEWGYDGLEIACWGDHFEVDRALAEDDYVDRKREQLAKHNLKVFAISNHLVGQAVCDLIDERHKLILPKDVYGDGDPEGVRKRAAKKMINQAFERTLSDGLAAEKQEFYNLFASEDQKEGMQAFMEKRRPEWKGK